METTKLIFTNEAVRRYRMMKFLEQLIYFLVLLMIVKSTIGQRNRGRGNRGSSRNRRTGSWGQWGAYGPCSVTCGVGEMIRSRRCRPERRICRGTSSSSMACSPDACVTSNSDYTEWSRYGECSVSCGGGLHSRTRRCLSASCTEHEEEIQNCNIGKCSGGRCSDQVASSTCRRFRNRCTVERIRNFCHKTCGVCKENDADERSWSSYGPCSVTCGAGIQTRFKGSDLQTITCIFAKCKSESPTWGSWGTERPCSVSCGGGEATRTRTCSVSGACEGPEEQVNRCQIQPCEDYTEWSQYGRCTDRCGGGTHSRYRTCLKFRCSGHDEEIVNCNTEECAKRNCLDKSPFSTCQRYKSLCSSRGVSNQCQKTCGVCKDTGDPSWSEYGPCSVTCGAGLKTRSKGSIRQRITCIMDTCKTDSGDERRWTAWIDVGECSVTCGGGGLQAQKRTCTEPDACSGPNETTVPCGDQPCPDSGDGRRWTAWIDVGACSVACGGGGLQAQKRTCIEPDVCSEEKTVPCGDQPCAAWNDWAEWSPCSADCGSGVRTRERVCNLPGQCIGNNIEQDDCYLKDCPPAAVWNDWNDWTECDVTCDGGKSERTRLCSIANQCGGNNREERTCSEEPCPSWSDWEDLTSCDKTCGEGTLVMRRQCSNPGMCVGNADKTVPCNLQECPNWKEWEDVTSCDKTCGEGTLLMRRQCSNPGLCVGNTDKTVSCSLQDCPTWTAWSGWEPCSTTCGTGQSTRTRSCTVLNGCIGNPVETEECIVKPCEAPQWSRCSKSCGGGTRRRYWCNGTDCIWQFEGCGEGKCPAALCGVFGILFANRYNSTHECCIKSHAPQGEQCGQQVKKVKEQSTGRRIIGGVDSVEDQWPWMVAVHMTEGGFCAGSLISNKFVLSAAHCFAHDSGQPRNVSTWKIYVGILKISQFSYDSGLKIKSTYIHPDYTYPIADIALVELENEVYYTPSIQPICLPHGEITPADSTCFVTGWGVSTVPDAVTNHLQELAIQNFDWRVCVEAYGRHAELKEHIPFLKENKGYVCAGSLSREIDSCSGDSGGPLVCQRCDSCSWYIAGVVSFGPNPCALIGVPAIYSKVVYYEDWIYATTQMTRHSLSCSKPQ